jgi:ATP-GRASP peptide maturase of grasp-with-spasm system
MILILSTDSDYCTKAVMECLIDWNIPVIRLNDNDILRCPMQVYIDGELKFKVRIEGKWLYSDDISVVWFRKFGFFYQYEGFEDIKKYFGIDYFYKVSAEQRKVLNLITKTLKNRHWLCNYTAIGLNKFDVLQKAESVGLKIPYSIITNHKEDLITDENLKSKKIITKAAGDILAVDLDEEHLLTTLTNDITAYKSILPKAFFPSFIQEKIDKLFELRVFYLDGDFYAMAIFSQGNKQTETDFRNYDREKPNRWLPYQLPNTIANKLDKLMKLIGLNTGSIDLIYSTKKEYIFLEVNPAGQFGMVSSPCNYNLEKKVALFLKKKFITHENDCKKAKSN